MNRDMGSPMLLPAPRRRDAGAANPVKRRGFKANALLRLTEKEVNITAN